MFGLKFGGTKERELASPPAWVTEELSIFREVFGSHVAPDMPAGSVGIVCDISTADAQILEMVFADPRVFVCVLEMPTMSLKDPAVRSVIERNLNRIGRFYDAVPHSYELFDEVMATDYDLPFAALREYAGAQLKVTRGLSRHVLDLPEIDYRYIRALRFWLGIFDRYPIGFVFSHRLEHGDLGDAISYAIASRKGIPVYNLGLEFSTGTVAAYALKEACVDGYRLCDAVEVLSGCADVDMAQFVHNPACTMTGTKRPDGLPDSGSRLASDCRAVESLRRAQTAKERFLADTASFATWISRDPRNAYRDWVHLQELRKIYSAIAERPIPQEKYVLYALHLEPEAAIINRGRISNQLFVIRLLADSLPPGWKLYVKEHPVQFELADPSRSGSFHLSNNIAFFRSARFYDDIRRLPNVRLIDIGIPSDGLIREAQAVATIRGTICLEAELVKKPLLVFSEDTTVMSAVNGVFRINSAGDVERAMKRIAAGYAPPYDNIEEVIRHGIVGAVKLGAANGEDRRQMLKRTFAYAIRRCGTNTGGKET